MVGSFFLLNLNAFGKTTSNFYLDPAYNTPQSKKFCDKNVKTVIDSKKIISITAPQNNREFASVIQSPLDLKQYLYQAKPGAEKIYVIAGPTKGGWIFQIQMTDIEYFVKEKIIHSLSYEFNKSKKSLTMTSSTGLVCNYSI